MADRDDEIMGPDSFGGEDFPSAPGASTLRATIERGDDRPLDFHVEGPTDDDATLSVDSGPEPGPEPTKDRDPRQHSTEGPAYVTREDFNAFACSVTGTLMELTRAQGAQALLGGIFRAASEQRGTKQGVGGMAGMRARRSRGGTEDEALADTASETEASTADLWWVVELLPIGPGVEPLRYRVRGHAPLGENYPYHAVRIGRHTFATERVLSIRAEDGTEYPTHFNPVNSEPQRVDASQDPEYAQIDARPFNPLSYSVERAQQTTEALVTFDAILSLAAISPELRQRMRRIVARGVAPDEAGSY